MSWLRIGAFYSFFQINNKHTFYLIMSESDLQTSRSGKRQYLVTYSQADYHKFATRESFGMMLEKEFNSGNSKVKVSHWACCKEMHEAGGFHYHCCLKLTGVKKWLSVKRDITKNHNIVVNFSDSHSHYIYAYRYVCKSDTEVAHSPGHPDLSEVGSPRTKASTAALREGSRKRRSASPNSQKCTSSKIKRRLSNLEVCDYVVENNIHNLQELFAKADSRKQEGECDLAIFLFSRAQKTLDELISKSWLLKSASSGLALRQVSRINKV